MRLPGPHSNQKDQTAAAKHPLEFIDLPVSALPFGLCGKPFNALDQHAAVPGPVEDNDLTVVG